MDDDKIIMALDNSSPAAPAGQRLKPKSGKIKRTLLIALVLVLISALIIYGAITQYLKRDTSGVPDAQTLENGFSLEPDTANAYCSFKGGLVVASSSRAALYDQSGITLYEHEMLSAAPAIAGGRDSVAVYDIGGTSLLVFNEKRTLFSYESKQKLINVSLNKKDWMTVAQLEDDYKGSVTVYNDRAKSVYKWYSAQGYVFSACLSPNSKYMCVVTLEQDREVFNSKVTIFALDSEDIYASYTLEDEMILAIKYTGNDSIACITEKNLLFLDGKAEEKAVYDYEGYNLQHYSLESEDYVVLALYRANSGLNGRVVTVDSAGRELGTSDINGTVQSISAAGGRVAVLLEDSLMFYTGRMKLDGGLNSTNGARKVLLRDDGSALILTYSDAKLYTP